MITKIVFLQHNDTSWNFDGFCFVRPYKKSGYACVHTWHLAAFQLDGTNDAEDLANVRTLCEIHYQHSFSGDT